MSNPAPSPARAADLAASADLAEAADAADQAAPSFAGVVLAAGSGSRFGGGKVRALLDGRPLVAHVLAAARAAGLRRVVLVLGRDAAAVLAALRADDPASLDGVLVAVNPAPERGLGTSLRLGLAAAGTLRRGDLREVRVLPVTTSGPAGVLVLLGDQPRVRREAIGALVAAAAHPSSDLLAVVPAYAQGGGANPALLLPPAWRLAAALDGDRGLGALLAAHHGRVLRVPLAGSNPDVDRPADLAALEGSPA